jgi:hypothetical protein
MRRLHLSWAATSTHHRPPCALLLLLLRRLRLSALLRLVRWRPAFAQGLHHVVHEPLRVWEVRISVTSHGQHGCTLCVSPRPQADENQALEGNLPLAGNSSKLDTMVRLSWALGVLPSKSDSTFCDSTFGSASVLPAPTPTSWMSETEPRAITLGVTGQSMRALGRDRPTELAVHASHNPNADRPNPMGSVLPIGLLPM